MNMVAKFVGARDFWKGLRVCSLPITLLINNQNASDKIRYHCCDRDGFLPPSGVSNIMASIAILVVIVLGPPYIL